MTHSYAKFISVFYLLALGLCWSLELFAASEKGISENPIIGLIIEVNGTPQRMIPDEEFAIISGDRFKIVATEFADHQQKASYVNLVGFVPQDEEERGRKDDRKIVVRSDRDLNQKWSLDKQGQLYQILAGQSAGRQAKFLLRVLPAELRYISLKVNGKDRVLRAGELARLKSSDRFIVKEVVTNVENDDKEVKYEIKPIPFNHPAFEGFRFYEISFSRNGKIFARIPIQIEGA